jgi:ubiquitin-activating enzyme E1
VDLSEGKKSAPTEEVKVTEEDHEVVSRLTKSLSELDLSRFKRLFPADFEKDNDKNHHIDFITSATNLRAWNYFIKPATRQKVRMVAGRIIPAIATTTASITGFIELEIYKYIKGVVLDKHRAATINLATNTFVCENLPDPQYKKSGMDPATYMTVVAIPEKFTCWDLVVVDKPDLTVEEFMAEFSRVHHNAVIDMFSTPSGIVLYNSVDLFDKNRKKVVEERLKRPLLQVYTELVGPVFPKSRNYILFECTVEDESGNTGIVPMVKYIFRK